MPTRSAHVTFSEPTPPLTSTQLSALSVLFHEAGYEFTADYRADKTIFHIADSAWCRELLQRLELPPSAKSWSEIAR